MSKEVDDILAFLRSEHLSDEDQAELIQRLRDGEGDTHRPAGTWVARTPTAIQIAAEGNGFKVGWIHGPDVDVDDNLEIVFFHGQMDGKPVIQIDGSADFRINVNESPVWDQHTDQDYDMPEELRQSYETRQSMLRKQLLSQVASKKEIKCGKCGGPHHTNYCEMKKEGE